MRGCRGIRLRTMVLGGGRYTTDADVVRFMNELSQLSTPGHRASVPRKAPAQERGRILSRFGVDASELSQDEQEGRETPHAS